MSETFKKTGWVNSLRTIDSYVDVTPSLDNGDGKFNEAIITRGGFNNTINNYRQADNSASVFVALGYGYDSNSQYSNNAGKTWHKSNLPTQMYWRQCVYENGMFFAIGQEEVGANTQVFYSYDGANWYSSETISSGYYNDITYSGHYGKFVMVGQNKIAISDDGIRWKEFSASKQYKSCCCYGGYDFIIAVPLQPFSGISYIEIVDGEISERTPPSSEISNYGSYGIIKVDSYGNFYVPIIDTIQEYDSNDNLIGCSILVNLAKSEDGWVWEFGDYIINEHFDEYIESNINYLSFAISETNIFSLVYPYISNFYFSKDNTKSWSSIPYTLDFPTSIVFVGNKTYLTSNTDAIYTEDYMNWEDADYNLYGGYSILEWGLNNSFTKLLTYDPQASVGYFDDVNVSLRLTKESMVSSPIQYSSGYSTDEFGYVENDGINIRLQTNGGSCRYIEIVGDLAKYEYPKDFSIMFPSVSDEINLEDRENSLETSTYNILDNNLVHCIIDLGEIRNLPNFINIKITRWSTPYSSVKLNYIGTNIKYSFSSRNILKSFELNNDVKDYDRFSYGLKYNSATMNLYNNERSAGKYMLRYETWSGGGIVSYNDKLVKPLTIVDILIDCQIDSLYKFYVKNNVDNNYILIGKYYSLEIEYNTQADNISISLYDICNRFQSIEYGGPSYRLTFKGIRSATLTEVLQAIKNDLISLYGISFDITNNYSDNITINKVVFTANTLWELLEQCCEIGMFYIIAEHTREDVDIKIFDRR